MLRTTQFACVHILFLLLGMRAVFNGCMVQLVQVCWLLSCLVAVLFGFVCCCCVVVLPCCLLFALSV